MAFLDTTNHEIVIRVVYDGPPEAGKTTSMRALATSFATRSVTPEENAQGRTQWFDWMEYVGGRFEGSEIRCQVISVPGQRELGRRRELLLESADVILFVGDTSPARWEVSLEYLFELHRQRADGIGIVFQANKRDLAGAIGIADLRARLGAARWDIGVVESVAADGTGIREAFVYAVRLALDRVREQTARGSLHEGRPADMSPEDLLARMREVEADAATSLEDSIEQAIAAAIGPVVAEPHSLAAELIGEVLALETAPALPPIPPVPAARIAAPHPPDASVPSGAIWPPVEGRAILMEVSQLGVTPRRHANGDWSAGLGSGWRLVSTRDALYESLDLGRAALVQWARLHAACTSIVSPRRCIVLAATGDGRWRLWQIVRAEESLRERVERTSSAEPEVVIDSLRLVAQTLVDVHTRLADAPCDLACSLDTVGACDASGMFIGLMPETATEPRVPRLPASLLLANELGPMLQLDLAERRDDLGRVLHDKPHEPDDTVMKSLSRLLSAC